MIDINTLNFEELIGLIKAQNNAWPKDMLINGTVWMMILGGLANKLTKQEIVLDSCIDKCRELFDFCVENDILIINKNICKHGGIYEVYYKINPTL